MSKEQKELLVALDIGTSKVVVVVAELMPEGHYEVIALGQNESKGMKKGVVVNIETTVQSIQKALEEAELMADCKITHVFTGIAGNHIHGFNSSGMVAVKDKEVTQADVARVIETAKAINIPTDQQLLHVLSQEFIIDGQGDVREPIGMSGIRLEVKVHIVTGSVSAAQNIIKCVRRCGLEVNDLVLQPLASSFAVLTEDEKELGVAALHAVGKSHSANDFANYHHRIEAVNYSLGHDDGASTREISEADVILIGVSRCGKTPTCLYLAMQFGIRAANYPLIPEDFANRQLPGTVKNLRSRLYGLTIKPERLQQIRNERRPGSTYATLSNCEFEVREAEAMMRRENIPFLDATSKSVEELATTIVQEAKLVRRIY